MSGSVTRLRVDDEAFLVASLIERCPKVMMLRELVQNALEAASLAPPGERCVEILPAKEAPSREGGARKLAIRNTGPGMGVEELFRMGDLAASIGKVKGLDGNFGMGAKVASLTSNRYGLTYRSCRSGRVHEMVLGERGGVYGRIRRTDPLVARPTEVLDITGSAMTSGTPLDRDWTEVVLLGNRPLQDTVADPFDGDPMPGADWIATGLYHRFLRLPAGVRILLHRGTHRLGGPREFRPLATRFAEFAHAESVKLPDGMTIHYLYDRPDGSGRNATEADALQDADSLAAVAYRNELYDVRQGWMWSQAGPRFGLSFGVQHISVIVELPDAHPVLPDGYRQFLRYARGAQEQVEVTDFAALVTAHRPAWLIDLLRTLGPDPDVARSIGEELQELLSGLKVRRGPRGVAQPSLPYVVAAAPSDGSAEVPPAEEERVIETPPAIVLLRDLRHVHDRLLDGRAAGYDLASHELFVNMRYPAIDEMVGTLIEGETGHADPGALARAAREAAEQVTIRRVGRALVHGLAKRDAAQGWNRWQLEAAISPEALTLAADDYVWSLPEARALLARGLGANS
jgi:hypothetical protein